MLPEHLHPKTYWEERCELLEEFVVRMFRIMANHGSPMQARDMASTMEEFNRLLSEIATKHPIP